MSYFSEADAASLRHNAPSFSGDLQTAPPELQRYLHYYGFHKLLGQNPVNHTFGFHSWHGYQIALHAWDLHTREKPDARGTVIVVHGLFDHSGLYLKLVQRLLDEGYNVVSFDLPGHGLSNGARVDIDDFGQYKAVLAECINGCEGSQPAPYFAVGQSTGGSAILHLLVDGGPAAAALQKVVLLAPLVRAHAWPVAVLAHTLLGHFIKKIPRHFGVNSHDKQFLHFLNHQDPLQTRYLATSWVSAMRNWAKKLQQAPASQADMLVIQGTCDTTVDWHWNIPLIKQKFPGTRTHYIEGAMHHLVGEAEPWRREVFDALCEFLNPN